jgi:hypothetical protein
LDKEQEKKERKNACGFNQLFSTVLGFLGFVSQLPTARNSAIQRRIVGMTASFPTSNELQ